jgi:hypothetical protein
LHWEVASVTGKQSRGFGGGGIDWSGGAAARGGSGSTMSSHGREKAGGRGKMASEHPYLTTVLLRRLVEGKKWRSGGAKGGRSSAMSGGDGARCTRVFRWKTAAAAWGEALGHGGLLNRRGQAAGLRPREVKVHTRLAPRSGTTLTGGPQLSARVGGGRKKGRRAGGLG